MAAAAIILGLASSHMVVAAGAWPADWPLQGEVLGLEEALRLAMRDNRPVRMAALDEESADDRLSVARSYRGPGLRIDINQGRLLKDLSFTFERGVFGDFAGTGPIPAEDVEITTRGTWTTIGVAQLTQPITQLRRIGLNVRLGEAGLDLARERSRARRQSVANDVRQAYYGVVQAQVALAAAEESVRFHQELDRVTDDRLAQGAALLADSLDVKARRLQAEQQRDAARRRLESRKENLNSLLGRDLATPFAAGPVERPAEFEVDLEAARRLALANRPDVREAALKVRQADLDHRLKRAESIPDLSFHASYLATANFELIPRDVVSVGFLLSWDPVDWGRRRRQASEAGRSARQAELARRETESQVLLEVGVRYRELQDARAQVEVARAALLAARERLRVAQDRFAQNAALLRDLLQAQDAAAQAHQQAEAALLSEWAARAELERAVGEDRVAAAGAEEPGPRGESGEGGGR